MTENLDATLAKNSLEERLARVRAQLSEKDRAREAREEDERLARELNDAELKLANATALEEAEAAHGKLGEKIAVTYTTHGAIIVKRPHANLFRRFMDAKSASTEEALKMVRPSVVYPDRSTFDQWIEEIPGALPSLAKQCAELSGVRFEEVAGK